MKKLLTCSLAILLSIALVACAPVPKLSPMQKRQMTSRTINGSYNNIFKATVTTLEDQEYIIKSADMKSGLITAEVAKNADFITRMITYSDGSYQTSDRLSVSATVDKISANTSEVRISIQEQAVSNTGGSLDANRVFDAEIYQKLFNDLTTEVKRREALGKS